MGKLHCSHSCASTALHRRLTASGHHRPKVQLTCEQCGKQWDVPPSYALNTSNGSPKRFCSLSCKRLAARQKWPVEQTNQVLYTCEECGGQWYGKRSLQYRKRYCSRTCGGVARVRQLRQDSPTSIEVATYEALNALGITYTPQHRIGRAVVDAYLPESHTVVECQGDFYHCNPAVYPDGPQGLIQRKTVARDQKRHALLRASGYRVVELWERDIRAVGADNLLADALGVSRGR